MHTGASDPIFTILYIHGKTYKAATVYQLCFLQAKKNHLVKTLAE